MTKDQPRARIRARDDVEFSRWERRARALQERLQKQSHNREERT